MVLSLDKSITGLGLIPDLMVFALVAEGSSVSQTAKVAGISRPTVLKRLGDLSTIFNKGTPLVENGKLTQHGVYFHSRIQPQISEIREALNVIFTPHAVDSLAWRSQRHSVFELDKKESCPPIIHHAWRAWREGNGDLDSVGMSHLVPWAIILRQFQNDWIVAEIGESSSFATWFGPKRARFFKSKTRKEFLTGSVSYRETGRVYDEVERWGSPILHHIQACIPRSEGSENEWISYQRLVLPIKWGDETGLASFVVRTNTIRIDTLSAEERHPMAPEFLMENDPTLRGKL